MMLIVNRWLAWRLANQALKNPRHQSLLKALAPPDPCLAWILWLVLLACPTAPAPAAEPLFDGLGNVGRKVTTSSPDAQHYFDQGLCFLYAFNHDEAIRSFEEASKLDPNCAMVWWGIAL